MKDADWTTWLARWSDAGLIDPETAGRIRAFEGTHAGSSRLRWPILVALAFGALMVGGGVLLFVAAHWDALSPAQRFAIVVALVGGFHVAGAVVADRFSWLASTLHAIGTVALGAGIALAGQIFNLDEHWPSGVMLWALGAAIAWALLGHLAQMALLAILTPAWLAGEWTVAIGERLDPVGDRVLACGLFMLAVTYFTASRPGHADDRRRVLVWVGGISLLPTALLLALVAASGWGSYREPADLSTMSGVLGWCLAIGAPVALALGLRRADSWPNAAAAVWVLALLALRAIAGTGALYPWWALGAIALVAWGIRDGRSERVNMGAAIFAATILAFYFSQVMDKLGRSASLMGLGLLFLAGGWALERIRRRLVEQARASA